jgi:hypothetical protein
MSIWASRQWILLLKSNAAEQTRDRTGTMRRRCPADWLQRDALLVPSMTLERGYTCGCLLSGNPRSVSKGPLLGRRTKPLAVGVASFLGLEVAEVFGFVSYVAR